MSVLAPATIAALRDAGRTRRVQPLFSNQIMAEMFDVAHGRGRFRVLPRVDGRFVVFDPLAPNGQSLPGEYASPTEAAEHAAHLSREANLRGEPNDRDRHGFKNDWGDPRVWEKFR